MAENLTNNQKSSKPKPKIGTIKSITEKKPIPSAPKAELPRQQPVSTFVKPIVTPEADIAKERKFVNTINLIGKNAGLGEIKKESPIYGSIVQSLKNTRDKGGLVSSKDDDGNPIYVQASTSGEQFSKGWDDFHDISAKGFGYIAGDRKEVIRNLNSNISKKPVLEIPKETGGISYLAGRMTPAIMQAIPGTVLSTVAPPAGAALTFAMSAPDAVAIKYAESLEENYKKSKEKGMSDDQAYESARGVATAAAGGEGILQSVFATLQIPSMMKPIFGMAEKKATATTMSEFVRRTGNTLKGAANVLKTPTTLGVTGAGIKAIEDIEAEKQGLQVEDKTTRAIENGSAFFMLDFGIKALTNIHKVPGYVKSSFSNLFTTADKKFIKQVVKEGENSGYYPKGTLNKLTKNVEDYSRVKEQTPDYEGDHVRQQVVVGLTQKLNNLLDRQSKLADIHKADLDGEINSVKERIAKAKNVENPLTAELAEDGTPLISQKENIIQETKTQQDATKTATKQVEESVPSSSVSEYKGAEKVENKATNEADNRNSLVGGKTTKEEVATATQKAEAAMEGLKTDDAAELMRIARRAFDKEEAKDFEGIAAIMRKEMESKLDMSNISDDTLIRLAEDAASKSEKYQFKAGPAKRIPLPTESYAKENILTNPREVFKAMFGTAKTVAEGMGERIKMAAEAIAEARKGKGLIIDVNKIQKSIEKFVTSKMTTDDASDSFAENLDDIIRSAENAKTNTANKGIIKDIKKASKSKSYGTVATKETTEGIDFISSSKVEDPSEYNRLLSDYKKSITGEIADSENPRKRLIDYVNAERQKYESIKRGKLEQKYDSLVAKGETPMTPGENPRVITKDEYVEVMTNPTSKKTPDLEAYEYNVNESKAEVMKEMTDVRQGMLKEAIGNGDIDDDILDAAKQISEVDVKKVNPKNIKLLNNIIEDVMNGEKPSRWNEILSDVEKFDKVQSLSNLRIRNIIRARTIGAINKVRSLFGYKGDKSKYDLMSLVNVLRNATFNDQDLAKLSSAILGDFNAAHNNVVEKSKLFASTMHDIFSGKSAVINGRKVDFTYTYKDRSAKSYLGTKYTIPELTELNSYRIGLASMLSQISDLPTNIATLGDMVKHLSEVAQSNKGEYSDKVKHIIDAMKSFDMIESVNWSGKEFKSAINSIRFKDDINIENILTKLNERESAALQYSRDTFKNLSGDLDNSLRQNFGETLDMSNENYSPFTVFFTENNQVIDLEGDIFDGIPEQMRTMRAGTTLDRNKNLVSTTNVGGKEYRVNYDLNFFTTMQRRYHESLNTAYTSKEVKTLNKLINDAGFQDFLSGKMGVNPQLFKDNKDVILNKIKTYVNMQRQPYILSKEQELQRSRLSKAVYGKLLNSWKQLFKQSIPSISYTITEAGIVPFTMANEFIFASLSSSEYREAMKAFAKQTSMSDRDLGGFEAYADAIANLDDSKISRYSKDAFDGIFKITSIPLNVGDKYASLTSLIVGYMKGLKSFGKINDYSQIDLLDILSKPLDKDALAYAENFQSIVNNSSNAAARAKVLREKNSSALRLLQSYNLNQWVNFNVDFGRMTDPMSTKADRLAAGKRIGQYLAMGGMFGYTSYQLAEIDKSIIRNYFNESGLDLAPEDMEKTEKLSDRDLLRVEIGTTIDMITGGMALPQQQASRFLAETGILYMQKSARDKMEKKGEIVKDTWAATDFNPIYKNNYIGLNGTLIDDIDRFSKKMMKKDDVEKDPLTPNNQRFVKKVDIFKGISLMLPIKDAESLVNAAEKRLERLGMTQEEKDLFMLGQLSNQSISQLERDDALLYINERRKSPDFDSYLQNRLVVDFNRKKDQAMLKKGMVKSFGSKIGQEMFNISNMNGSKLFKVMNNRYPDLDYSNSRELSYMIQSGAISPEEYAMAVVYDKEGRVRIDQTNEELSNLIKDRYIKAGMISTSEKFDKASSQQTIDQLVNIFMNLRNQRQRERDIIR